jgi:putative Ca2+/H+ antiporter (TMEM165/GDT1 family)
LPIIFGILAATLLNHALAAFAGQQVAGLLDAPWFRWAVALGFVAMALWTLVPDKIDDDEGEVSHKGSIFLTTAIAFFLVEMGDKTQVATVALGAQYQSVFAVAAGDDSGHDAGQCARRLSGRRAGQTGAAACDALDRGGSFSGVGLVADLGIDTTMRRNSPEI